MKRTIPFSKAAKRNAAFALVFGVVPAGLLALGNSYNVEILEKCNDGNTAACSEVVTSLRDKITNADFLAEQKRIAKAKAEEAARKVQEESQRRAAAAEAKAKAEEARLARGEWKYHTWTDAATGKTAKYGHVFSKNTVNFDFPYSGPQRGEFTIRNHPRYGVDAMLEVERGQLLCDSYSNTTVLVRFDSGPATRYSCNGAADHSSDIVFIKGVGRIEAGMKRAKKMFVTVNVYQEGQQTFEFNVRGYDRSKI